MGVHTYAVHGLVLTGRMISSRDSFEAIRSSTKHALVEQ